MKTFKRVTGKRYQTLTVLIMMMFLISCGGGGQNRQSERQLEEAKQETIQSINKIKVDIQDRIKYVDQEMENTTGETRDELQTARRELEAQCDILDAEMEEVNEASLDTWNEVINSTSQTLAETRKKVNEVSIEVRTMLDGE
ncbi:MAG: hypothetical protein ACOCX0_02130 [Bacteroidota bacterium]